ncbi:hypothetical protein [Paenibacillus piri]|uniref:Short-chain dehydrogenase n=1 Tax=Paenibacillus piri TaxID=2547395 RepID=A0A4R5KD44_9BACL|nr:hypothetical protein [Paenibacillus piri]TDF92802.1 hypothetical protein E1757_29270 [Paenibacillus piri]
MIYYLLGIAAIVCIFAFIVSAVVIKKQENQEYDKGMNHLTRKHNIIANPILIAYVLFPLVIVLGAAVLIYYYGG